MKICINIKVWQRPEVFRNVLRSISEQETVHEIEIVCAFSEDDPHLDQSYDAAIEHDCMLMCAQNLPLSSKANSLARASKYLDWDYLMILGSDDVVGPGFFDAYGEYFDDKAWGWTDLYMYEPSQIVTVHGEGPGETTRHKGRFVYWPGYTNGRNESIGAGRVLRRDVVERLDWQLHEEGQNRNLDSSMTARLKAIGVEVPHGKLPHGVYLVDCKDDESITPLGAFRQEDLVDMAVPDVLRRYL